jgi:hypothetical protein
MKSCYFFKLMVMAAFLGLGLLAAEGAVAQAPSGPIMAKPSQESAPAVNAPPPAPAPTPRTTILGAWKLNKDDSDEPSQGQDTQTSNGGNRRMGGGYPGGGYPGGGGGNGGYGGHRMGGESDEQRQKMEALLRPARSLAVSMTGAEIDMVDEAEHKIAFITDGRKLQKSKDASYEEIAARWEGTRLISDEKDPRGKPMSRTFELNEDGRQLLETLHITSSKSNSSRTIRYVYDIPLPAHQTKQ